MDDSRRKFLKRSALAVSTGALVLGTPGISPPIFAAPWVHATSKTSQDPSSRKPTLVIIYLRGGADALNTIVPFADDRYYAMRPTLAITHPKDARAVAAGTAAIPLNSHFGLHPAMAPLKPFFDSGQFAPIVSVGSTHGTRSHFDAQDFMERAAPGVKALHEGWLNRYLRLTATPEDHFLRAYCPQALLPRSMRGEYPVLAAPGSSSMDALAAFKDLYKRQPNSGEGLKRKREEFERRQKLTPAERKREDRKRRRDALGEPPQTAKELVPLIQNAGADTVDKLSKLNVLLANSRKRTKKLYPKGNLGAQLGDIATLIKAGQPLEITAIDYGGWDHHSFQGGSTGTMSTMLSQLSRCIASFAKDVGSEKMKNVTVMTMTEFGRTASENGTQGTDHGHGGFMLALGGRVNGGRLHGKWKGLNKSNLYQGRDLAVHTDFRDVFAEALHQLYKFDTREGSFFPGYDKVMRKPLGLFV